MSPLYIKFVILFIGLYLLYKEKSSLPDGPFSAMLQAVPLAALRSKETRLRSRVLPLPAHGSRLAEYRGSALVRGRGEASG